MLTIPRHQLQAIAMMLEREGGGVESCRFPSTWETTRFSERAKRYVLAIDDSTLFIMGRRYRNTVTGVYSEYATPSMGGLLADVRFLIGSLYQKIMC